MAAGHDGPDANLPAPPFASPEEEVFWGKVSAQVARRRQRKSARNQRIATTALFLLVALPGALWMVQESRPVYLSSRNDSTPRSGAREERDLIGIGAVGTKGRGGGQGGYGPEASGLGGKHTEVVIAEDEATVSGPLDPALIRQVIQRNRGQLRFCYESVLARHPALAGEVTVRFNVLADGTPTHVIVYQSTVNNPELEACVTGRFRNWLFPMPTGEGPVRVTYPIRFQVTGSE